MFVVIAGQPLKFSDGFSVPCVSFPGLLHLSSLSFDLSVSVADSIQLGHIFPTHSVSLSFLTGILIHVRLM